MSKRKPKITIHIFKDFAENYTGDDLYWKSFFLNLSQGNLPKGVTFIPNVIFYKNKDIDDCYELPENMKDAYEYAKIVFDKIVNQRKNDLKNKKPLYADNWKDIKPAYRDILIKDFIKKQKQLYRLSDQKCKELYSDIIHLISVKAIKNEDFVLENLQLVGIKNISFHSGKYTLLKIKNPRKFTTEMKMTNIKTTNNTNRVNYNELWKNYIHNI